MSQTTSEYDSIFYFPDKQIFIPEIVSKYLNYLFNNLIIILCRSSNVLIHSLKRTRFKAAKPSPKYFK